MEKRKVRWENVEIRTGKSTSPEFWKPQEGTYHISLRVEREINLLKGRFGWQAVFRLRIEGKDMLWAIPVTLEDNKIIAAPESRISQILELKREYGTGWHQLMVQVEGKGNQRKYILKHLQTCQCLQESL